MYIVLTFCRTAALIVFFSLYLSKISVPIPLKISKKKIRTINLPVFTSFAVSIYSWSLSYQGHAYNVPDLVNWEHWIIHVNSSDWNDTYICLNFGTFSWFRFQTPLPLFMFWNSIIFCYRFLRSQILLSILIGWLLCFILTVTGSLSSNPEEKAYLARTDAKLGVMDLTEWFYVPHPGRHFISLFAWLLTHRLHKYMHAIVPDHCLLFSLTSCLIVWLHSIMWYENKVLKCGETSSENKFYSKYDNR